MKRDFEPIISVIMPCLNVVKYIDLCLESVIRQTLRDIEIIVVDAGSVDGTLDIVEKYAVKDNRVRLISSNKKSYGYQLNLGIVSARGRYVGIVETDDYIEPNMYETLLQAAMEEDADLVKGNAEMFLVRNGLTVTRKMYSYPDNDIKVRITENPSRYPWLWHDDAFVWTGIYKRDFINKFSLRETPGAAFQDISFLFNVLSNAQKAVYLPNIFYHYRQDNNQASSYSNKSMDFICDEYSAIKELLPGLSAGWRYIYYRRMTSHILNRLNFMVYGGKFWEDAWSSIEWLQKEVKSAIAQGILTNTNYERQEDWDDVLLFLENPRRIFDNRIVDFRNRQYQKRHIADDLYREAGWIILGTGEMEISMLRGLLLYGIKVCALCDEDSMFWGKKILGVDVISPHSAKEKFPYASVMFWDAVQAEKLHDKKDFDLNEARLSADEALLLEKTDIRLFTADF